MSISIIIPVYNTRKYLRECLDSVVMQSVPFDKIIIVNDGSTDGSELICEQYAEKYSNIVLINKENEGLGKTRNAGFEMVDTDYVMFLDSDDYIRKDAAETVRCNVEKHNLDILYFDTRVIYENIEHEDKKNVRYDRTGKVSAKIMNGKEYFIENYPLYYVESVCMAAFRTNFLKNNKIIFPGVIYEDIYFAFKAMLSACKVRYLPERLYVRRYRDNSIMTSGFGDDNCVSIIKVTSMCWDYILSEKIYNESGIREVLYIYLFESLDIVKRFVRNNIYTCYFDKPEYKRLQEKFMKIYSAMGISRWNISFRLALNIYRFYLSLDKEKDSILIDYFSEGNVNYFKEIYVEKLQKKLEVLPLGNNDSVICIYGTGGHTEQLLEWYRGIVGEIKCRLIYANTDVDSPCEYNGELLYDIKCINEVDMIIISSSKYEKEMYANVKKLYGDKYQIVRFYDEEKEDIFIDYRAT